LARKTMRFACHLFCLLSGSDWGEPL